MADDGSGFWGDIGTGAQNFFGGINSAFSGANPGMMPMLGLFQGAGAASTPSRMPVTKGMVFGDLAGGWGQGMQAGQQAQAAQFDLNQKALANAVAMWRLDAQSAAINRQPIPAFDPQRYMGRSLMGGSSAPFGVPSSGMGATGTSPGAANAGSAAPQSGASASPPGGGTLMATNGPAGTAPAQGAPAQSAPQSGGTSPVSPDLTSEAFRQDLLFPGAGKEIIAKQYSGPTDYQRAIDYARSLPEGPEKQQALMAATKASGVEVSPNVRAGSAQLQWDPATNSYKVGFKNPVLPEGMDYDPATGKAYQVPGAFEGIDEQARIHARAELGMHQDLAHYTAGLTKAEWEEKNPNGDIVKKQGTGLDYLAAVNGGRVPGAVPPATGAPAAPASGAPGASSAAPVPIPQPKPPVPGPAAPASPQPAPSPTASAAPSSNKLDIPVGGTEKQGKVAEAAGEAAATSQKIQATTEGLNAAIDRALAINDKVPSGSYGTAEAKVGMSNLPYIGDGQAAKYAALYHQEIGSNILSGLQQLKGLGRLDIPEVNQVIQTYGIGMENNPDARRAALLNLRQIINNNAAIAKNTTANLNQPGAATSTERAPVTNTPVTGDKAPAQSEGGTKAPTFAVGQTATGPKGQKIQWDGTAWKPINGQ